MSQSHFTLSFPLKSPADAEAVATELPSMMAELFNAADAIGTIHYSRFTLLSDKTLLFLGDFDGEFGELMTDLAKRAGPVFDATFKHVVSPPPTLHPFLVVLPIKSKLAFIEVQLLPRAREQRGLGIIAHGSHKSGPMFLTFPTLA